ncbi:transmembrane 9 superfamily member 3 isoform X1 [Ricinus communis]|uniref:transmembrane 9 superfamily member 3 isoform X1 n=1 Tax=Ricinus communis TaxID=3988 RepID=UPI00201AF7D9|nr:transmembrane 9 superfamily member 3 isoform X1 [Ricinus communis]
MNDNNPFIILVVSVLIIACSVTHVRSDASDHRYKDGDPVPLYANKVGPFHNPSETYRYFDLPFCVPDHLKEKTEALGEVLNGDRLVSAPYKLNFRDEKDTAVVCRKKLTKEEVGRFRSAVDKDYYFQMYYDDLPVWGFIGKIDKQDNKYFLYKHIQFDVLYNKDRVIEVNTRMDPQSLLDLTEDKNVDAEFLYTVKWKETDIPFEKRMDKYSFSSSLPHHLEIHWFSIINSCVTVLLLTGFLATILMRVLKNDFMKYAQDEEAADDQEETGWKYIHGDVFRYPKYKSLFAAALGSGTQLFALTVFIFMLALVGVFYPYNRGALFTALVVIYALTSGIAGYTATSFYYQLEGTNWVRNLLLTGCLFCGPLFLTFCFLNTVAIIYSATAALPFGTILVILLIWTLVTSPLLVLGGIAGKNSKAEFQAPCRTTKYPREVPQLPWYRSALPQMGMAGFLPFSAIYIELYYIFASVWGHRIYTIYSILFIVFIILLIVTAFITVALTYFQLAAEDHEWWWRKRYVQGGWLKSITPSKSFESAKASHNGLFDESPAVIFSQVYLFALRLLKLLNLSFLCGGSTGLFIYAYCLYYYYARSDMSGFMQTSFFFGYMACICYGFFLMLGTVGFRASLLFVRHIYRSIKCE